MTVAKALRWLTWPAALGIAYVFLSTEQYKLSGHPQAVWLFTALTDWMHLGDHEKAFRLFTAACEIAASVLVLIPKTRVYGAVLGLLVMTGALFFLLVSPVGIDPGHDGAALFKTTCATWLAAAFVIAVYRDQLKALLSR